MKLSLILLFTLAGCAVERGPVYVKDGKQYGVTASRVWRERWWNYYECGSSYAEGEFWDNAIADFQTAITQRQDDQRRARTYGLHFIDYFPHRELGVVYYRLARHPDAIRELEISLVSVDNAKAKFYLNKARQSLLQQHGGDTTPPRLRLDTPANDLITNRFMVEVAGQAEDDTYVSSITINGRPQFVELAEPRIPFTQAIALHDGENTIDIVAADLIGYSTHERLRVHLDRQGPLLNLDRVEVIGNPPLQRVHIDGVLADRSGISHFVLGGQLVQLPAGTDWEFHQEVLLPPGMTFVPFEAEDVAGNITRGEIQLTPAVNDPGRDGAIPTRPRWTLAYPDTVIADPPALYTVASRSAPPPDQHAPVIKLPGLVEQQILYDDTIYIEGQVTDASMITALAINGESLWRRPSRQIFFGQKFALQVGENTFLVEALDEAGNKAQRTIVVRRELQPVKRVGSRLRVSLLPFTQQGQASVLSEAVYDNLFSDVVSQGRFDIVERQQLEPILQELKLSQTALVDPATAAKAGKIMAAEGMLLGAVTETPQAMEVFVRFVDVESSLSEKLDMDMPLSYGLGLSARLSDRLTLSLDVSRVHWSDFQLEQSSRDDVLLVENGAPSGKGRAVLNGEGDDTTNVRLGAEYLWIRSPMVIPFRAGLFYDPEPGDGDLDQFFGFSLGSGIAIGQFLFDIAYMFRAGTVESQATDTTVYQHTFLASVIMHF